MSGDVLPDGPAAPAREIEIREAAAGDLAEVARIHGLAFPELLMTRLGPSYVRAYYAEILDCPGRVFRVACRAGRLVGYVAGTLDPAGFAARLDGRRASQAWAMLPGLLRRPWLALAVLGQRRRRQRRRGREAVPTLEIAFVAVAPAAGRRGLGRRLVLAALAEGTGLGATRARLFIRRDAAAHVRGLYEGLGFVLAGKGRGARTDLEEHEIDLSASS